MKGSFRIARIAGIDVAVHYTWLLIFTFITWSLAVGYFPELYQGWETWLYWVTGAISAILLFLSVLLHELAHSIVAKSQGLQVKGITLFLLGGISNLETEPQKPGLEFLIAIVGPLSSMLLAGIFKAVDWLGYAPQGPVKAIVDYVVLLNILLAAFNVLPGFPLDGGRVLRSIIWGATNDLKKATSIASIVGQVFGWIFIAGGVFIALAGDLMGGIWLVLIGLFLNGAAEAARRELEMRSIWLNVRVSSVMNDHPETVEPSASVSSLVNEVFIKRGLRVAPVVQDNVLQGIVTIADIKKIPASDWPMTSIGKIMTVLPLKTVKPEDNMSTAVQMMAENRFDQLPVIVDSRLVGVLSRADIIRYVQVHYELGKR